MHSIELVHAEVLVGAANEIKDACVPHSGIISLVVRLIEGPTTEVAMIGKGSVFSTSAALVGPTALTTAIVGLTATACEGYETVKGELEQLKPNTLH